MALTPGHGVSAFTDVTAPIGEGGIRQVYRARDAKLDRDVAIQILPKRSRTMPIVSPVSNVKPRRSPH